GITRPAEESPSAPHFANNLGQRYATKVVSNRLFCTLRHNAHNTLHVATHWACLERSPLIYRNDRARLNRIIDIHQRDSFWSPTQTRSTVFAGECFDQLCPSQGE